MSDIEVNKMKFSKREVEGAKAAKLFIQKLGYPSVQNAVLLLQSGAINQVPCNSSDHLDRTRAGLDSSKPKEEHREAPRKNNRTLLRDFSHRRHFSRELQRTWFPILAWQPDKEID
jgi:hypothetical protein